MAKKSAYSKGYRKYQPKKHEMTKEEKKKLLIGIIAFVALVAIVVIVLAIVDNIGVMRVNSDLEVVDAGPLDLIKNTQTQSNPRVYKMGELTEAVPGYTEEEVIQKLNVSSYPYFKADDENAAVTSYGVIVGKGNYDELCESVYGKSGYGTVIEQSEVTTTEISGKKCCYFTSLTSMDESEEGDGSELSYYDDMYCYVEGKFDGYCILVQMTGRADENGNAITTEEEFLSVLTQVMDRLVVLDKHGK